MKCQFLFNGDNLHEMSNLFFFFFFFFWRKRKSITNVLSAELAQRVVKVNIFHQIDSQ